MASPRSSSSSPVVWYRNPWFILAAIAVVAFIGLNAPPDHSAASVAPISSAPLDLSASVASVAPVAPVPAPVPQVIAPPITNNNVIVLGQQDAQQLLEALPVPPVEDPSPSDVPIRASAVAPDCLPEMVAHHRRVAQFYERMANNSK